MLHAFMRAALKGHTLGEAGAVPANPAQWGEAGWGVRSTVPITKGQLVVELCGRWLSEAEPWGGYLYLGSFQGDHIARVNASRLWPAAAS